MGKKVAAGTPDEETRRLIFYKADIRKITTVLRAFLENAHATGVLLVDKSGSFLAREGGLGSYEADAISALVAGTFDAVRKMAKDLGEPNAPLMWPGKGKENIHLVPIGERTVLVVIYAESASMNLVLLHALQVVAKLTELFAEIRRRPT